MVLADGFFEWRHENKKTYPYYIRLKDHSPFAFAGIWDKWNNPETKEQIQTFSVITTSANSLLEKIHNTQKRMPVILSAKSERNWLRNDLRKDDMMAMLQPYNADEMEAYPVSKKVREVGLSTENPEVIARQEYQDLPALLA